MYTRTVLRPIRELFISKHQIVRSVSIANKVVSNESVCNLKSWKEIPGPSSLPLIGTALHHLPGGSFYNLDGKAVTRTLYNTYGPIVRQENPIGMNAFIFLYDAELVEQVLRGENRMPVRIGLKTLEYYRKHVKEKNPGDLIGLLAEKGEPWQKFRSAVNPILLPPESVKLYAQHLNDVALEMVERIKTVRDENNMIKSMFDKEMNLWAVESMGVVALGCRIGCFDLSLPEDAPARRLIRCVREVLTLGDELDLKPSIWRYIATPKFKRIMNLYKEQETISKYFIDKAKQTFGDASKNGMEKSMLEKLLQINENVAQVMASDMLFGGVDTTAVSATSALYLLAKNQDKQKKLREELKNDPGTKYLKACLKESLRVMPVLPGNLRITTKDYNINGYRIPANSTVAFIHQDMSLMEKYFVRSKEYLPERWLVDKNDPLYYRNAHPFAYNPFGFGVRSCIGRRIAELELETLVSRMVENFHIQWVGPPPPIKQSSINYLKGPYYFVFNDVKN